MTIGISGVDDKAYVLNIDVNFDTDTLTAEGVDEIQTGDARPSSVIQEIGFNSLLQ